MVLEVYKRWRGFCQRLETRTDVDVLLLGPGRLDRFGVSRTTALHCTAVSGRSHYHHATSSYWARAVWTDSVYPALHCSFRSITLSSCHALLPIANCKHCSHLFFAYFLGRSIHKRAVDMMGGPIRCIPYYTAVSSRSNYHHATVLLPIATCKHCSHLFLFTFISSDKVYIKEL